MFLNWNGLQKVPKGSGFDDAVSFQSHRCGAVNRTVYKRLAELERVRATASLVRRSAAWIDGSATEPFQKILDAHGIEQREEESPGSAVARALGISTQDLRSCLQQIANGHDHQEPG